MNSFFQKKLTSTFVIFSLLFTGFLPAAAEAPNPVNYVAVGDSLTYGLGAAEINYLRINAFVPRFVRFLRTEDSVHVENYGIPGLTASNLIVLLENDNALATRLAEANLISITIGGNDLLNIIRANPEANEANFQAALDMLIRNIKTLNHTLKSLNSQATIIYVGLYNPYPTTHNHFSIAELFVERFNRALTDIVQDKHTVVANPSPFFKAKSERLTHILEDDIHPNDDGYSKIYESVKIAYLQLQKG